MLFVDIALEVAMVGYAAVTPPIEPYSRAILRRELPKQQVAVNTYLKLTRLKSDPLQACRRDAAGTCCMANHQARCLEELAAAASRHCLKPARVRRVRLQEVQRTSLQWSPMRLSILATVRQEV